MKIVNINSCNYGSTGNIMLSVAETAKQFEDATLVCYPKSRSNAKKQRAYDLTIGNRFSRNVHLVLNKLTGLNGCYSLFSTLHFLRKIDKWHPDVVHIHNLHNCYINLPLLFCYLKRKSVSNIWTLHDCWSFTGQCPHFIMANCDKWKNGCHNCPQIHSYPSTMVDRTKLMWRLKRKWFTGVPDMTIVTPSQWLADLVKESYLKDYKTVVINNGIDLTKFKPRKSNFRNQYGLENKAILLGVAFDWSPRKGIDVFKRLAEELPENYAIVLVGVSDVVAKNLPNRIIPIACTQSQDELAEIYSTADIFVNPTREDNFPTVNMEALACGTPVITFDTGGSPEIIDETCGIVVPCDDIPALEKAIYHVVEDQPFTAEACRKRAEQFDMQDKFAEYVKLYHELCDKQ